MIQKYLLFPLFFFMGIIICQASQRAYAESFIAVSDIHFDPFAQCEQNSPASSLAQKCEIVEALVQSPAEKWPTIFALKDHTPLPTHHQETNFSLLQSTLNFIKTTDASSSAFIVLGGDYLAHNYREKYIFYSHDTSLQGYESFVQKTMIFLMQDFHQAFPTLAIIPTLGNNDSYSGDYFSNPNGLYYQDMGKLFSPLSGNPSGFFQTFNAGGYYLAALPQTPNQTTQAEQISDKISDQIIVLNSVLFSARAKAKNSSINSMNELTLAANQELAWLDQKLTQSELQHKKVWILMHIPDVIDDYASHQVGREVPLWKSQFNKQFLAILEKHAAIIKIILTGHFHRDGSFIYHFPSSKNSAKTSTLLDSYLPGIDSTHGNPPGFKIYDFDPQTFELTQMSEYDLNQSEDWTWKKSYQKNPNKI